jgi:hypothetical protein
MPPQAWFETVSMLASKQDGSGRWVLGNWAAQYNSVGNGKLYPVMTESRKFQKKVTTSIGQGWSSISQLEACRGSLHCLVWLCSADTAQCMPEKQFRHDLP